MIILQIIIIMIIRFCIFYRERQPILYMAGLYNRYQNEDRFVILTTLANESMKPVHDRMPLLLEQISDFEQMSLFPVENSK